MKKLITLAFITVIAFSANAQTFSNYLLAFESHLKQEVFLDQWNNVKEKWLTDSRAELTTTNALLLMARLESNLNLNYMKDDWGTKRNQWLAELKTANTFQQLAGLLNTLSSNMKANAYTDSWLEYKGQWEEGLKGMQ